MNYRAGADFERAVRADLAADGFEVIRSAGSKTPVDLVAFKTGELVFVQCKRDGRLTPADRVRLLRLAGLVAATPVLASRATGVPGTPACPGRRAAVRRYSRRCGPAIAYARLTGPGPADRAPWTADRPDTR